MSEDQHPPGETEPTRDDSPDPDSGSGRTIRQGGGRPDDGLPGKQIGDFELLGELGRGGMGVVYEARQLSLNRRVALKVLPPGLGLTDQAVQRFGREARAAAGLHHTNIVPVYAIGEEEGSHYYVMELIEGQPLSEVLKDLSGPGSNPLMDKTVTQLGGDEAAGPEPDATASTPSITSFSDSSAGSRKWFDVVAKLVSEVADALHYAHGRGVIHRDIKPANLMLSRDGRLCVTDFGLARVAQEPGMTVSGSLMGTPAYMSPEQIAVGRVKLDHRTDIYSLGAVLYEMLANRRPFPGESREEILSGILTKDPRPPRRFNPRIPLDLETICQKAMEKDPDLRYQSAGAFANDLRQYLQRGLITARRAGIVRRTWKSVRRHPVSASVSVGTVAVAIVAMFAVQQCAGRSEEALARRIAEARHQVTRGEFREAMKGVARILESDPGNNEALLIRARIHLQQKHYVDCVADAREVLQEEPEHWEAHALIATAGARGPVYSIPVDEHRRRAEEGAPDTADAAFLRGALAQYMWGEEEDRGDSREAIRWLTEALDKDPGHALALEARSDAHVSLKQFPAALADAERLISALPRNVQGHTQKSSVLRNLRDLDGALQVANRAIEIDPESPDGYVNQAMAWRDKGDLPAQIEAMSKAIELDPRLMRAFDERGLALRYSGRYDEAVADHRKCVEINPDNGRYYESLFWTLWQAGRRDEAVGVLEDLEERAGHWSSEACTRYPPFLWLRYYLEIGEFERAEQEADRLIELVPHKILGYAERIEIRRRMRGEAAVEEDCDLLAALELDLPEELLRRANLMRGSCNRESAALADYEAAIEMAPSWADPPRNRAILNRDKKRYDEALADLERAIALAPSWTDPYYQRGLTYAAMERFEEALADYERCVEMGNNSLELRNEQARALVRLGRDEEALQALQAFLDENPNSNRGWIERARSLFDMGRVKEAVAALDHILEINPGNDNIKSFRAFYASFDPDSCEESAKAMEEYAAREAGNPVTWFNIAYIHVVAFYYFCPEHYDPDLALELAEKTARLDSQNWVYQGLYAIVLYRHGRYEEALKVWDRASDLEARPNPYTLFRLSMTHAQLGHGRQARDYYDRAVEQMDRRRSRGPDITAIRREAAEVLGIEP